MAYLKLVHNIHDNISFVRIINTPKRGVGQKFLESLEADAISHKCSLWDVLILWFEKHRSPKRVKVTKATRNTMTRFIQLIRRLMRKTLPHVILNTVLESVNYKQHLETNDENSAEDRWENVQELLNICAQFEFEMQPATKNSQQDTTPLGSFLEYVSLYASSDSMEDPSKEHDSVTISTIHSAKGLEWGAVFLPGWKYLCNFK